MSIDVFKLPVFPAADVFPMMADDELRELANDIKVNGVREPIVIANGELVDGRNRREACRIAGVTPPIRELNGEDPTAYVLSANIHRRHMSKVQRAMAVAYIYPEVEAAHRGKKAKASGFHEAIDVSKGHAANLVSQARAVYNEAPDLAPIVLSGALSLDEAFKTVKERRNAAQSKEARVERVRRTYPELAEKVTINELTIDGAEAEARARDAIRREQRQSAFRMIREGMFSVGAFGLADQADEISELLSDDGAKDELLKHFKDDPEEFGKQLEAFLSGFPRLVSLLNNLNGSAL